MRKVLVSTFGLLLFATGYVAYPFLTAWSIREAIRTGDSAYLERKIEWETVRAAMRRSLADGAMGLGGRPAARAEQASQKAGLWQRLKTYVGNRALDRFVDGYVTPAGLPQLFTYGKFYRERIRGEEDEARTLAWHRRFARFWSRVKRAEFHSPARFEIEMADRYDPGRHYIGLLELRGIEWRLVELRVRLAAGA